jgi:hypothetical protein
MTPSLGSKRSSTPAGDEAAERIRCTKCLRSDLWHRLELVERMLEPEIRTQVTTWPDGIVIEVRRCSCGSSIARKTTREG